MYCACKILCVVRIKSIVVWGFRLEYNVVYNVVAWGLSAAPAASPMHSKSIWMDSESTRNKTKSDYVKNQYTYVHVNLLVGALAGSRKSWGEASWNRGGLVQEHWKEPGAHFIYQKNARVHFRWELAILGSGPGHLATHPHPQPPPSPPSLSETAETKRARTGSPEIPFLGWPQTGSPEIPSKSKLNLTMYSNLIFQFCIQIMYPTYVLDLCMRIQFSNYALKQLCSESILSIAMPVAYCLLDSAWIMYSNYIFELCSESMC